MSVPDSPPERPSANINFTYLNSVAIHLFHFKSKICICVVPNTVYGQELHTRWVNVKHPHWCLWSSVGRKGRPVTVWVFLRSLNQTGQVEQLGRGDLTRRLWSSVDMDSGRLGYSLSVHFWQAIRWCCCLHQQGYGLWHCLPRLISYVLIFSTITLILLENLFLEMIIVKLYSPFIVC